MNQIRGASPQGRVLYTFTPLRNFDSQETQSTYLKGMRYSVREGNDKLDGLVNQWKQEGLVK